MQALAPSANTPFTIEVSGSMSFTDADALDGVMLLENTPRLARPNRAAVLHPDQLAVTEFLAVNAEPDLSSLSGFVYADTNLNGILDRDASGVALEMGLPNVTVTLRDAQGVVTATTTGADGSYLFDDLPTALYRIDETQPPFFISGINSLGEILPSGASRGVVGVDSFSNIQLNEAEQGVDYNFAEIPVPDKRMFTSRADMRRILSGQLGVAARTVQGTPANDTIVVEALADAIQVTVNDEPPQQFSLPEARVLFVDASEGEDTVVMKGSSAPEVANLSPGAGTLRRGTDYNDANFAVMAVAAEQVSAEGQGGDDLAIFRDSFGDDELVAAGQSATLASDTARQAAASTFERVRALSSRGGDDTVDEDATDYVLELIGDWQSV
jgi:hypothetical protein